MKVICGCQNGVLKPGVRYTYNLCGEIQATNRLNHEGSLLSNEVEQTLESNTIGHEKTNSI